MPKLILAEGNYLSQYYVDLPTPNGGVVKMKTTEFLSELACMSEDEQMATLEWMVPVNAQYLGLDPATITMAVTTAVEIGKKALEWIKQNNPFKDDPPLQQGYQYPGLETLKQQIAAGFYTYKDGAIFLGKNHPLTKTGPGRGVPIGVSFPVGTFYANVPDEAIAALDKEYQKAVVNVVKPAAAPAPSTVPAAKTPTMPKAPGNDKNFNISYTNREWYENPWLWGGVGVAALATVFILSRRN